MYINSVTIIHIYQLTDFNMNGLWNTYGGRSLAGTDNARGNICNLNEDDLQHYHAASQSRVPTFLL